MSALEEEIEMTNEVAYRLSLRHPNNHVTKRKKFGSVTNGIVIGEMMNDAICLYKKGEPKEEIIKKTKLTSVWVERAIRDYNKRNSL